MRKGTVLGTLTLAAVVAAWAALAAQSTSSGVRGSKQTPVLETYAQKVTHGREPARLLPAAPMRASLEPDPQVEPLDEPDSEGDEPSAPKRPRPPLTIEMERVMFRDYFTDLETKLQVAPDPGLTNAVRAKVEETVKKRGALAVHVVSVHCGSGLCRVELKNPEPRTGNAERALIVLADAQRAAGLMEATVYAHPDEIVSVAFLAKSHELPDMNTEARYEKLFGNKRNL